MTILPMRIDIQVSESIQEYGLQVSGSNESISLTPAESINVTVVQGDPYEGPYVVVPKIIEQTLETKDKHMEEDVLICEIPYYETSNIQNGITVFIADNLDD